MTRSRKQPRPALQPEEIARRILQRELGKPVVVHDDGSRTRMYDLRVGHAIDPDVAIECVAALDPERVETWNVGPALGALTLPVASDWHFVLRPNAVVKQIRSELPSVIREVSDLELDGYVHVDAFLEVRERALFVRLNRLRIHAFGRYPGDGRVTFGMTGLGGAVDPTGIAVPQWIGDFLRAPEREDVLYKLEISGAAERHAFVFVDLGGVPWLVESYLGSNSEILPQDAPDLPPPVKTVWIMYGKRGLRWDGVSWGFFNAVVPVSAAEMAMATATTLPNLGVKSDGT